MSAMAGIHRLGTEIDGVHDNTELQPFSSTRRAALSAGAVRKYDIRKSSTAGAGRYAVYSVAEPLCAD